MQLQKVHETPVKIARNTEIQLKKPRQTLEQFGVLVDRWRFDPTTPSCLAPRSCILLLHPLPVVQCKQLEVCSQLRARSLLHFPLLHM